MPDSIMDLLQTPNELYDNQMIPGFIQGTVVENNNKDYPGMVKVSFTVWEKGKNMIEWIRLMSPYAGDSYGSYVVPEIGETVLIGFIGGSLKKPVLMGSLHVKDSSLVKDSFDEKNTKKVFKTKGGIEVAVSDEDGKQSVVIRTPKEQQLVIEDEQETILLSDKNGKNKLLLNLKGGEMSLEAEKKMQFKAGSVSFNLDGNSGKIQIECNTMEVKAKQSVTMEGQTQMQLKGASAKLEGMQTLELKASGQTAISGGIVKIN